MTDSAQIPNPEKYPHIHADDSTARAGQKVLELHFSRMIENEAGTVLGENIEALHDMRVATRRMRTAVDLFRDFFNPEAIRKIRKGLRKTGKRLGRVRDLDVLLEKTKLDLDSGSPTKINGLELLIEHWSTERVPARRRMMAYLKGEKYLGFKKRLGHFLHTPEAAIRRQDHNPPARNMAPRLIRDHLENVRSYQQIITAPTLDELHALRIAFKGLRYTIEFFYHLLGEEILFCIDFLKRVQDHLGDINDARVTTAKLEKITQNSALAPILRSAGSRYQVVKRDELANLIETFPATWDQFTGSEFEQHLQSALTNIGRS